MHPRYTVFHPENETCISVRQAYDPDFAAFFRLWRPGRAGGRAVAGEYFSCILPAVCAFTGFNMHLAAGFRDLEPLVAVSRF